MSSYNFKETYSFAYEPWMESAILELQFFQGKKISDIPAETKILAKGVVTTPLMAKIGQVQVNEPIPNVGMYIPTGLLDRDMMQSKTFNFLYPAGESVFSPRYKSNQAQLTALRQFLIDNPAIASFKITGIQSPEREEGRNSKLGYDRAESLGAYLYDQKVVADSSKITKNARWNDWFDFRILLRDYEKLSTQRRDAYYNVLMNGGLYETQREQLSDIPGFAAVSADLFPMLRATKVEVMARPVQGLSAEENERLQKALQGNGMNTDLSVIDWALAGETAPRLEDKEKIYVKMTELFRTALPYNNLAVVKMRQANRSISKVERDSLLYKAMVLLRQAERIETSPYILHNLGQIMILRGEYWEAYKKLSDASVLTRKEDFLKVNESLRGALDILRGDYKLATLRFDYDYSEPKDFFNKGLAYYMAKNYANASINFEESVLANREYGYGYYGLAMVAAASRQTDVALIHLAKAIETNEVLYQKALIDPVFEELRREPEFFEIFKSGSTDTER
ncbi:tetratricopeptide repeat protein [Algoriphagus namhaensis]